MDIKTWNKKRQLYKYVRNLLIDHSDWEIKGNNFIHKKTDIQIHMSEWQLEIVEPAITKFGWLQTRKLRKILEEMRLDTNLRAVLKSKTKGGELL